MDILLNSINNNQRSMYMLNNTINITYINT